LDGHNTHVVTDGYDESAFDHAKASPLCVGKPTIVLLGTYYPHFQEAIEKLARVLYEVNKDAELVFIGQAAAQVHAMSLPNSTCIMHLPKRKAIEFALGASFLLLVMPPYAKWTPMKTYDYLRIGRPILGLVPADDDPARLIQQTKAGFVLPFDEQEMREKLKEILGRWKRGDFDRFRPNPRCVNKFEWGEIMRQMTEVFNAATSQCYCASP
jgi:glycosyltransferase involved in cell wall biosynthesis